MDDRGSCWGHGMGRLCTVRRAAKATLIIKGRLPKWGKSLNARFGLLCTGCVIEEDDEEGNHVQSQLNIYSSSYNMSLAY